LPLFAAILESKEERVFKKKYYIDGTEEVARLPKYM
jgi:hypothetical protein